ncbi:hypothetical protein FXO38_35710 [Capsicum annuum]|uniref:Protein kinase domain-containing protein n=1 Tax=Capsicum annuum TaxID=4072 RepID=A0A2G2Z8L2_CAPAN|nr:hypothetical protein FXO38_35710 [Capsicum annuum]KAF3614452.1 hypothetical protein FXO37_35936 [Capsicum annuum]PHT78205.1 hypothetical protein T459_16257 [Capsicum annuum]
MRSLDNFLHEHEGSARGLSYLHDVCCPEIVHQDIKSSNIRRDQNLEPRVSDFGLAEFLVDEEAYITSVVMGTFGYLALEYLQSRRATEKYDHAQGKFRYGVNTNLPLHGKGKEYDDCARKL